MSNPWAAIEGHLGLQRAVGVILYIRERGRASAGSGGATVAAADDAAADVAGDASAESGSSVDGGDADEGDDGGALDKNVVVEVRAMMQQDSVRD